MPRPPSSASRATPSTRASSTRCASWRRCSRTWGSRRDRRRPGRLPRHPRLRGPVAERGHRRRGRPARAAASRHDGAQEPGRGRADPRERPLVRARPPAAAGVLACPARPRPRPACARATKRHSPCSRRSGPRYGQQASSDGVSAGYRGQIGQRSSWAHAIAHNIEFQAGDVLVTRDERAHLGLQRRARAGDDHRRADRRDAPPVRPHGRPRSRPRSTRCGRASPAPTSTSAVCATSRRNDLLPYWRQHTGHAIGLRNHEPPFLDIGDHTPIEPGMVFTIEPGVYDQRARRLPPLGHRGRHGRRRDRDPHLVSHRDRRTDHPGLVLLPQARRRRDMSRSFLDRHVPSHVRKRRRRPRTADCKRLCCPSPTAGSRHVSSSNEGCKTVTDRPQAVGPSCRRATSLLGFGGRRRPRGGRCRSR